MTSAGTRRVASVGAAIVLLTLLVRAALGLDLSRIRLELQGASLSWIVGTLTLYFLLLPLWALQWRLLSPSTARNTFGTMLGIVALTSSVLNTTALFVGETVGIVLLVSQVGLTRAAALSVLVMDQLLVGITKVAVLTAGGLTLVLPGWMSPGRTALEIGVGVLLLGCLVAAWWYEPLVAFADRFLPERVVEAVGGLGRGLEPLRAPSRGGVSLALAMAKAAVEVLAIMCVQRAFGEALPLSSALYVLGAINVLALAPVVPGNLGVYEGTVVLVYTHLGVPAERALGMAMAQHACQFIALALPGYVWMLRSIRLRAAIARS